MDARLMINVHRRLGNSPGADGLGAGLQMSREIADAEPLGGKGNLTAANLGVPNFRVAGGTGTWRYCRKR